MKFKYSKTKAKQILKKYELGGAFMTNDLAGHYSGGTGGLNSKLPLNGFTGTKYTGLVGETGALSSGELFAKGGALEHGLQIGDEIQGIMNNVVFVEKNDRNFVVNLNKGQRISQEQFDKMSYKEQQNFCSM